MKVGPFCGLEQVWGVRGVCITRSPSLGARQIGLASAFVSFVEGIKKLEGMHEG